MSFAPRFRPGRHPCPAFSAPASLGRRASGPNRTFPSRATAAGLLRLALLWLCAAQAVAQDPFQTLPSLSPPPAAPAPESSVPAGESPQPAPGSLAEPSHAANAGSVSAAAEGLAPGACRPVAVLVVADRGLALCRLGAAYHRVSLGAPWPGTASRLVYIGAGGSLLLRDAEGAERTLRPG